MAKSKYNIARTLGNIFAVVHLSRRAFYILGLLMDGKKSFILYNDMAVPFKTLPLDEAGILINAVFEYQNGGVVQHLSPSVMMAFTFIKQQLDRDAGKYEDTCRQNRVNAQKRWDKANPADTPACDRMRPDAKHADTDTDTDTDTENGLDSEKEEKKDIRHKHGDKVELTDKEYQTHIEKRGKDTVDTMIDDMNDWCVSKGESFDNYSRALHVWFKRDEKKAKAKLAADIDMWDNPR